MDKFNTISLAKAMITGVGIPTKYDDGSTPEKALRAALIEANGGSTKIDYKQLRRNKVEIFEIIEELIPTIVVEGLKGDEFFMNLVDYRNVALGDDIDFWTEDKGEFIVSTLANGSQGVYRQRLDVGEKMNVKTALRGIKVFDHLARFLAGRTDWNTFITKTASAMKKKYLEVVYDVFDAITASTTGMSATYYKSGTLVEDDLSTLIQHVEAATGKIATIYGTKTALSKVTTAVVSEKAREDIYNIGFYGKFKGTNMVEVKQVHKAGTDDFMFDDTKLYIIASDDKPIKMVDKGEALIIDTDPENNADLTKEYMIAQDFGAGVLINGKLGIWDM